jgi:hypothetical protein
LLGLHYRIEYKKGTENKAVDALSRCEGQNGNFLHMTAELTSFSELIPQWVQDIKASYQDDDWVAAQLRKLQDCPFDACHFTIHQEILRYKGRICVRRYGNWRQLMLKELHDSFQGDHSGINVTYHRLR